MPRERPRGGDRGRRQRLERRHGRGRPGALSRGAGDRAAEPGARGRLERRHGGRVRPLLPDPERGCMADRRRARPPRPARRRASGGRGRRPAAAEHERDAAALGARLPDALAARDRVLLPPQARAADAPAERVLRGRVRARRGSRRRGRDGRVHARTPRGGRAGRPARRRVLPLQRGDGLVLPLPPGRLEGALLPGRGVRARRRRVARRPDAPRERARAPALPRQAPQRRATPSARGGFSAGACGCAPLSTATSAAGCTETWPPGSRPGRMPELLDR